MTIMKEHSLTPRLPLGVLLALLAACGGGSKDGPGNVTVDSNVDDGFDRAAMLASLSERVFVPVYQGFDQRADTLASATTAYCEALGKEGEVAALEAVRTAWQEAMSAWQLAEAMLIGPAAMDERALRNVVYSWPLVNSCAVDQDVMRKLQDPAYDISTQLVNRRGLAALEYVLFAPSLEVTCPPQSAPAGWDALGEPERRAARCAFAAAAAADLAASAQRIADGWAPEGGDYGGELARAGQSGSSLPSAQEAANLVSDAMFYVDSMVKDMKLAETAGITQNRCGTVQEPCLDELESPWADHGRENILANLRGLRMVFTGDGPGDTGTDGPGFDDFLRARNAGMLASTMLADLDAAIAAVEAIPGPLGSALASESGQQLVIAAHTAVKKVTDNLKSQFLTVLGLDIPDDAATDND